MGSLAAGMEYGGEVRTGAAEGVTMVAGRGKVNGEIRTAGCRRAQPRARTEDVLPEAGILSMVSYDFLKQNQRSHDDGSEWYSLVHF